jgi:hypothetical protein
MKSRQHYCFETLLPRIRSDNIYSSIYFQA